MGPEDRGVLYPLGHDRPQLPLRSQVMLPLQLWSPPPLKLWSLSLREAIGICKQMSFLVSNNSDVSPGTGFELCQATSTPKET